VCNTKKNLKVKSKLNFEWKYLKKHPQISSENRTYIDFIINGKSLSELLGGVGNNIGKFGWKINLKYELDEFERLKKGKKSNSENGLFSAYICAECGDEGCGAVMFRILETKNTIEWKDFVWSDGYFDKNEPDEKIEINPIIFDKDEYNIALSELKLKISE